MELSLRQIRYFIATVNAGQVSKAARDVHISQSAITAAIKTLEDIIGMPLFERHVSGMTLTYEGNLFYQHACRIIDTVDEAFRIPRRFGADIRGTINLAVSYTISGYFLPPLLARFSHLFPNITVHLVEADRENIEEGLITGNFNLAVMLTSNIVHHDEISQATLLRSRRRLWVGAHHRFLEQENVSLRDIADEPYIMLTVDEASNTALRYWKKTAYRPNTIFRTSSVEAVRSMVASGMGVSILSDLVHRPWSLEGRRIEALEVAEPVPTMDVGLAWHERAEQDEATRNFVDFMHLSISASQYRHHGTQHRATV